MAFGLQLSRLLASLEALTFVIMLPAHQGHCSTNADATQSTQPASWGKVPEILKRIRPPAFRSHDFNITNFGARPDGITDCTGAFKSAIQACNKAGGGRVVVPQGIYSSGAIHLLSNVDLQVEKGATIQFSTNVEKYLPLVFSRGVAEMMNYSPFVYAFEQENVAITGEGTLDGQASKGEWPNWVKRDPGDSGKLIELGDKEVPVQQRIMGPGRFIRPCFVELVRCRNVLIQGVTVRDSANWVLHPLYCTNVTVDGVTVSSHGKNNDGCDPDSCTDVLIQNCVFDDGDDCIAVKAGRDHDGRRVNIPCENIVIRHCIFKDGHGGVTLGSETAGGIRKVFAEDCEFDSPDQDNALRFKTNPTRGGYIRDIYIRNCNIRMAKFGVHMTMRYFSKEVKDASHVALVSDIDIRDCVFNTITKQAVFIEGWSPEAQITDVTIANCKFPANAPDNTITNASRISMTGNTVARPK
jgi:polygalacturonase